MSIYPDYFGRELIPGAWVILAINSGRSSVLEHGRIAGFYPSGRIKVAKTGRFYCKSAGAAVPKIYNSAHVHSNRMVMISEMEVPQEKIEHFKDWKPDEE